jgi:short-subunit dehydrogenase
MKLAGSRVLLTGASGGIGIEILQLLLQRDARVMAVSNQTGLDPEQLGELAQDARRLRLIKGDLTDAVFRATVADEVAQWGGGRLDILINAAGAADFALLEHQDARGIEFLARLNLVAPMDLTRLVLPLLAASSQALIVNLGSVFGAIGYPGNAVYSATKFGLRGFSEALRRELADTHIDVLYLAPRATHTPLNRPAVNDLNERLGNSVDSAALVANLIRRAIARSRAEVTFGWPEKLFVRVNALLPRVVDSAIGSKLAIIKQFAKRNKGKE